MSDPGGRTFLGTGMGWPLALAAEPGGALARAAFEASVRQSIWIILGTAPGERVMRPDFGCGIHDLVFATNSPATAGRVAAEVREALLRFETRIDVLDVQVSTPSAGVMLVSIDYEIRATNNAFNLVYPFYLGGGG